MNSGDTTVRKTRALTMRTLPLMLTCREVDVFMVDYLEDILPKDQRRIFDWHLRLCPDCRRYLEDYKQTIVLTKAAFCESKTPVPEHVPEDLVKAILAACGSR